MYDLFSFCSWPQVFVRDSTFSYLFVSVIVDVSHSRVVVVSCHSVDFVSIVVPETLLKPP